MIICFSYYFPKLNIWSGRKSSGVCFNRIVQMGNARALQDLKVMVSKVVKVRELDFVMYSI